jgi:hypothetical protein
MFYDELFNILDMIFNHTLNNDIKFQIKKLKKKISLKKFLDLKEYEQRKEIFNLIEEVRYGFDTVKPQKIRAIDTIEKIIREKIIKKESECQIEH